MNDSPSSKAALRQVTLLFASSLTVMAGATVAPALPRLATVFEGEPHADLLVRLVLTLPALFIAILAPAAGWVIDRFGRRSTLLVSAVLYALAGSSGLYLDSLTGILIGRAALGVAVAGVMTASTTLLGDYFTGPHRNRLMGWQAASMAFGGGVFLTLGGVLADISWRGPFVIYLASLAVVPAALLSIGRHPPSTADPDHPAAGPGGVPVGTVLLLYAVAFTGMAAFYMIPVQVPFHLESLTGASGTAIGLAITASTLCGATVSSFYRPIKDRLSFPAVFAVLFGLMAAGYFIVSTATTYWTVVAGLIVSGTATGLLMPNLNVWLLAEAPEAVRGRLVGGLTTALFLGQFCSPIMVRPLIEAEGVAAAFAGVAGLMVLLSLGFTAFVLQRGQPESIQPEGGER